MRPADSAAEAVAPRQHFDALQAYRGLAALGVLLFHLTALFKFRLGVDFAARKFLHSGYLGADFFFVLSGFIILYTHRDDVGRPAMARKFVTRRLTRLYPVFLSVCLIKLATLAIFGVHGEKISTGGLLMSLLLLPQPGAPLLDVAWSLSFELVFYALFLLLILRGSSPWRIILAHAVAVAVVNLPGMPELQFPLRFVFSPYFLEFYAGCLVCQVAFSRTWRKREAAAILAAGLGMVLVGWLWHLGPLRGLQIQGYFRQAVFWSTAFGLVALGTVALGERLNRFVPRPLKFMGDASYSIYLVHGSVLNLGILLLKSHLPGREPLAGIFAVVVGAGALLAGCLYHRLVEQPLLNLCRRWFPEKN
ncbi:MAG: hypothetical protein RL380_877 [Verrucomicrobiota bacterium]